MIFYIVASAISIFLLGLSIVELYKYIFSKVQLYSGIFTLFALFMWIGYLYIVSSMFNITYILIVTVIAAIPICYIARKITEKINGNIISFCHLIRAAKTSEEPKEVPKINLEDIFSE